MKLTIEADNACEIIDFLKRLSLEKDAVKCVVSNSEIYNPMAMSYSIGEDLGKLSSEVISNFTSD